MSAKWGNSAINEIKFKQNGVTNDVKKVQKANGTVMWCKPFTLTKNYGTGVRSYNVFRGSTEEPTASHGSTAYLGNGDTIYYGDVIYVSNPTPESGYTIETYNPHNDEYIIKLFYSNNLSF